MNEPPTPASMPPHDPQLRPEQPPAPEILTTSPREAPRGKFSNHPAVLAVARVIAYFIAVFITTYCLMWLGTSLFPEPVGGVAALWREMFQEFAMLLGAVVPAVLLARFEGRSFDEFGLPWRKAFGKSFGMGAAWGLGAITVLMITLRLAQVFWFGQFALHGVRIVKFAVFWGVYFVLVGLFEEFLLRGYPLQTLARGIGFWPAALVLSIGFGAIHVRNPGETWIGLLGVVVIGMFFCFTVYRTGNLWFAVGFHAFWDWGQTYLYSVPDSGTMAPGHLMRPVFHGQDWLTGGTVGPEASVFCFVVIAGVWGVFARRHREVKWEDRTLLRPSAANNV